MKNMKHLPSLIRAEMLNIAPKTNLDRESGVQMRLQLGFGGGLRFRRGGF